jgi:rhodanese-related sulfurtransferase
VGAPHARIGPEEAHARMQRGWTYLDVRTPEEFALGHPAGAFNVPLELLAPDGMRRNPRFVDAVRARLGDAHLIVGCKSGNRSKTAIALLAGAVLGEIVEQHAGWDGARGEFGEVVEPGWLRVGLPSERGEPSGRSWNDLAAE